MPAIVRVLAELVRSMPRLPDVPRAYRALFVVDGFVYGGRGSALTNLTWRRRSTGPTPAEVRVSLALTPVPSYRLHLPHRESLLVPTAPVWRDVHPAEELLTRSVGLAAAGGMNLGALQDLREVRVGEVFRFRVADPDSWRLLPAPSFGLPRPRTPTEPVDPVSQALRAAESF